MLEYLVRLLILYILCAALQFQMRVWIGTHQKLLLADDIDVLEYGLLWLIAGHHVFIDKLLGRVEGLAHWLLIFVIICVVIVLRLGDLYRLKWGRNCAAVVWSVNQLFFNSYAWLLLLFLIGSLITQFNFHLTRRWLLLAGVHWKSIYYNCL